MIEAVFSHHHVEHQLNLLTHEMMCRRIARLQVVENNIWQQHRRDVLIALHADFKTVQEILRVFVVDFADQVSGPLESAICRRLECSLITTTVQPTVAFARELSSKLRLHCGSSR